MTDLFVYEEMLHERTSNHNRQWRDLLGRTYSEVRPEVTAGLSWRLADGKAVTLGIVFAHASDLTETELRALLDSRSEASLLVVLVSQGPRDGRRLGNGMVYQLGRSAPYPDPAQGREYRATVLGFRRSVDDFCIDWQTTGIPDFTLLESGERRGGLTERHHWHELKNAINELALVALVQM